MAKSREPSPVADAGRLGRTDRAQGVLLLDSARPRPVELLHALAKRGIHPRLVFHPAEVMVALAEGCTTMLIIEEPRRLRRLEKLKAAVGRYYPQTACWQYQRPDPAAPNGRAGSGGLSHLVSQGSSRRCGEVDGDTTPQHSPLESASSRLDLENAGGDADEDTRSTAAPGLPLPNPLITQDELAMLVGAGGDGNGWEPTGDDEMSFDDGEEGE